MAATTTPLTLGQCFTFNIEPDNMMCSCLTVENNRCSNAHKFLYKLSNGNTHTCCGISGHKKYIFKHYLTEGIIANVYRFKYDHKQGNNYHCTYSVCGIDIDNKCNYEYPIIKNRDSIHNIKTVLQTDINEQDKQLTDLRQSIDEFTKYITNLHREIYTTREIRNELSRALSFVEENATFTNSKTQLTEQNDVCVICHEQMTNSDSTKLAECNHAFHLKCIKRWFHKKNTISCPCCRTICNKDNYFVLNKFV
tara:strand:+ start:2419 stop:3174 length:756 start_codon:yes stop_codon:yes gene_type:complete